MINELVWIGCYLFVGLVIAAAVRMFVPDSERGPTWRQVDAILSITVVWPIVILMILYGLCCEIQFRRSQRNILKRQHPHSQRRDYADEHYQDSDDDA